jgi:hypothetical protein
LILFSQRNKKKYYSEYSLRKAIVNRLFLLNVLVEKA